MEERFDILKCPNCGMEMRRGVTTKSQRPWLDWYPGRNPPATGWAMAKVPDVKKARDLSRGVRFVGRLWNFFLDYHPSWYCHECGLLLIDTKVELER